MKKSKLSLIHQSVLQCTRCPELRQYCETVGIEKRKAYDKWDYHAGPVPGFGDPNAWLWIVGLAPAAHGANRTGRMFTGDRSGDFLYAGLHRNKLANQAEAVSVDDGLILNGVYISAAVHCAPPANKPTKEQIQHCSSFLVDEYHALKNAKVILALGGIAWNAVLTLMKQVGYSIPSPKPKFGHKTVLKWETVSLIGCYHVSQQNTFTGRLTPAMFDEVIKTAREWSLG
jgi:uracil-DNA glycosylase family 4